MKTEVANRSNAVGSDSLELGLMSRAEYAHFLDVRIHQCARIIGKRFYRLAEYLYLMKRHRLWREAGYDSFEAYLSSVDANISVAQANLWIRVVRKFFRNRELMERLQRAMGELRQERGIEPVDFESLPASKLDDVLPAVTKLVQRGQDAKAAELIMLARSPTEGGLSRTDLQQHLAELGFKKQPTRTYLCLKGIASAEMVETDDYQQLLGDKYDMVIEEPRFVKGRPLDSGGKIC